MREPPIGVETLPCPRCRPCLAPLARCLVPLFSPLSNPCLARYLIPYLADYLVLHTAPYVAPYNPHSPPSQVKKSNLQQLYDRRRMTEVRSWRLGEARLFM